jgi:uncharacterized membrane protein
MTPYQLINPANPGSPIWIANQVARENATRTAAETSTVAEVNDTAEDGDVEMVVVFSFTIVLALLFALFVAFMAAQELKNS